MSDKPPGEPKPFYIPQEAIARADMREAAVSGKKPQPPIARPNKETGQEECPS